MFTVYLPDCTCDFARFIIFNNLSNNKMLDLDPQWVHEASYEFLGSQ
jgi:hypothetical protein